MKELAEKLLIYLWACVPLFHVARLENSQECEWWTKAKKDSYSIKQFCHVEYYQDLYDMCELECYEITDLAAEPDCKNLSDIGITLTWWVKGAYSKAMKHFFVRFSKIVVDEEGSSSDIVKIPMPEIAKPVWDRDVHFRFVYRGADDVFFLRRDGRYRITITTNSAHCDPDDHVTVTIGDRECRNGGIPSGPTWPTRVIWTGASSAFILLLIFAGLLWITKRRQCVKEGSPIQHPPDAVNALLLLNPAVLDHSLRESVNNIATFMNELPDIHADYNIRNSNDPEQIDWIRRTLAEDDIVVIVSAPDEAEKSELYATFNRSLEILLNGWIDSASPKVIVAHSSEATLHAKCPFLQSRRYTTQELAASPTENARALRDHILQMIRPEHEAQSLV